MRRTSHGVYVLKSLHFHQIQPCFLFSDDLHVRSKKTVIGPPLQKLYNKVQYSANYACYVGSYMTYKGYTIQNLYKII